MNKTINTELNNKKTIRPYYNGLFHGYHQLYNSYDNLSLRCVYKYGKEIGYKENHRIKETKYHIK